MIEPIQALYTETAAFIFENLVQPVIWELGLMAYLEDAFNWTEFALLGAVAVAVTWLVCRPFEFWRPVERWTEAKPVRTDVVYTLLVKLGVVPLLFFVVLQPIGLAIDGTLRLWGFVPPSLEQLIPFLDGNWFLTFVAYVLVLDFADYWRHRLQHRWSWWWALHSVHHSQRQMTFWTDDRNHLLDDAIAAAWFGAVAMLIGVPPNMFPLIVLWLKLVESFSHVNARVHFGRVGNWLLVSPLFHRHHHALAHAEKPYDRFHGCNFAALFPLWDLLFGTAQMRADWDRTGDLSGSEAEAKGGWARTQLEGLKRLLRTLGGYLVRKPRVAANV